MEYVEIPLRLSLIFQISTSVGNVSRLMHLNFAVVDKISFFPPFARDAFSNIDIFETLPALIAQKTFCFIKS